MKCPVCDYPMEPEEFSICPQCFFEFGVDNLDYTIEELLNEWIQKGRPFLSKTVDRFVK